MNFLCIGEVWEVTFLNLPETATEVRAGLGDAALLQRIKAWGGHLTVEASPDVAGRAVEDTLLALTKAGIQNLLIVAPYRLHDGRIYYLPSGDTGISAPEVVVDKQDLKALAEAAGLAEYASQWTDGKKVLMIWFFIDQAGKPVEITVAGAPMAPDIQAKIMRIVKVTTPAKRGTDPVPGVATVRIDFQ